MIILPPGFVATKYPGYFWHLEKQALFTCKSGTLRPLKRRSANRWNYGNAGYAISVGGRRRYIFESVLKKLVLADALFPMVTK